MNYKEFGCRHEKTVLLLHGGGLSWWNYREAAQDLGEDFHVVLPILDGHAEADRPFTSIEDNAAEIVAWIRTHLGGQIFALGGLSLGGQIALEMLAQDGGLCEHALIESAMVIPSRATAAMIRPAFGCSYPLVKQKWFARMQFRSLHIREDLFEDYFRDTARIAKADMIAFLEASTLYAPKEALRQCTADVCIFCGGRETRGIRKSAEILGNLFPHSTVRVLPGMVHGDFSINHAHEFTETIRSFASE